MSRHAPAVSSAELQGRGIVLEASGADVKKQLSALQAVGAGSHVRYGVPGDLLAF